METYQFETAALFTANQIELFPSQPILYLVNGSANRQLNKLEESIESLLMGLDYILDNKALEIDFYKQLSRAYKQQDNIEASEAFNRKAIALEQPE